MSPHRHSRRPDSTCLANSRCTYDVNRQGWPAIRWGEPRRPPPFSIASRLGWQRFRLARALFGTHCLPYNECLRSPPYIVTSGHRFSPLTQSVEPFPFPQLWCVVMLFSYDYCINLTRVSTRHTETRPQQHSHSWPAHPTRPPSMKACAPRSA